MSPIWVFVLLPTLTLGDALSDATALHAKLDVNKDGALSKDEILTTVSTFDANKDNALSKTELNNFAVANVPTIVQPTLAWGRYVDTNKDGLISRTEFDAAFSALDGNKNGNVDYLEFGAYAALMAPIVLLW
ncbi:uncharacterized protein LOC131946047 [Physella acuta]|uniref:uncharacterized protein LOC131946047 n=1 Tax=Physella acuta TaxID=109671 RepID=UPI0027DDE8CF|nr:uncharacterized protein LOC131946047 [Physella acuta]